MSVHPSEYTYGLGATVRAHRAYIGVTVQVMASLIPINPASLARIEADARAVPPGFLDTLRDVVEQFDEDVAACPVGSIRPRLAGLSRYGSPVLAAAVPGESESEYGRAVALRALLALARTTPGKVGVVTST